MVVLNRNLLDFDEESFGVYGNQFLNHGKGLRSPQEPKIRFQYQVKRFFTRQGPCKSALPFFSQLAAVTKPMPPMGFEKTLLLHATDTTFRDGDGAKVSSVWRCGLDDWTGVLSGVRRSRVPSASKE
jgi:hypothetical protein